MTMNRLFRHIALVFIATLAQFVFADEATGLPLIVDGTSSSVGYYLGSKGPASNATRWEEKGVSFQGYRFEFNRITGLLGNEEFTTLASGYMTTDCSGALYAQEEAPPGMVFPIWATPNTSGSQSGPLHYVPQPFRAQDVTRVTLRSKRNPSTGQCETVNTTIDAIVAPPNIPQETGISSPSIPTPITISAASLFQDGFENPLLATIGFGGPMRS